MLVSLATKDGGTDKISHVFFSVMANLRCSSRYPWESARTGVDVTPDCCPEVRLYQMHITGDVAFAARQYFAATGDREWLLNELGGDLIYETARYWGSRAIYNDEKEQYEILSKLLTRLKSFSSFFFSLSHSCFTTR
jgi:Glycosyl hydrolase family 65 central catalytic domain